MALVTENISKQQNSSQNCVLCNGNHNENETIM